MHELGLDKDLISIIEMIKIVNWGFW
jgi:hypothetical protein